MRPTLRLLLLLLAWTALGRTVAWGQVCATPGKDGSPTSLSGVVNTYFPGSGTAASGSKSISVAAVSSTTGTGITAGDLLLIIQMQGADINSTDGTAYGANNGTGSGNLTADFTAGIYEYIVANSTLAAGAAGTITTATNLVNSYSAAAATATTGRRSFQVVRIPQYANVTLGGQVNAAAWNGSTGGVLVMDVAGTLTLAGQTLNATASGFRGGAGIQYTGNVAAGGDNTTYRTASTVATTNTGVNGTKGEGTAGTPRYTAIGNTTLVDNTTTLTNAFASSITDGYANGDNGRGAPGNAGGGATDGQSPANNGYNAGGAGGGNGASGGFGGSPRSASGSTSVLTYRALGGVAFAATSSRLVMGGGGGAGSNNDGVGSGGNVNNGIGSSGAAGGGIILVRVGSLSGTGTASAAGAGGYTIAGLGSSDGTGGGGAGGTVLVTAKNTAGLANLTVTATGGAGSNNQNTIDVAHGPGGGGSGGVVLANGALAAATSVVGGAAGTTTYGLGGTVSTFGATAGANGTSTTNISSAIANSAVGADCVADLSSVITAPPSANVGQNISAQVTFSNAGPAAAPATGTITVPAGATVLSATGGTISVAGNGVTTITYAIASLAVNGSRAFTIMYRATAAGTVAVNSNITSTTLDLVAGNNASSASTAISITGAAGTPGPCATPGKDGNVTLATAASPNTYYPSNGAQSLPANATSISLGAATGASTPIAVGDLLLVIQMQGATITNANDNTYGTISATGYTAGQYEYVVANSAVPVGGGTVSLQTGLKNAYTSAVATASNGQRSFQVVRVPQYANLTLSSNLVATPWNGSSGGIIALDVANQTNLTGKTISASGAGFRGGGGRRLVGVTPTTGYAGTDYRSTAGNVGPTSSGPQTAPTTSVAGVSGTKGEGTAGTPRYVSTGTALLDTYTSVNGLPNTLTDGYPSGDNGRGAPGTAGGGGTDADPAGNSQNSGGGGGANGGRGGRGGNTWSSNSAVGGEPGMAFAPASSSRLVLGGGGGAGSTNNGSNNASIFDGFNSSGAAGGGIVILRTGSLNSAGGTITADGASASSVVAGDGNGGGGAGGSILVTAAVPSSVSYLTLSVAGGIGGSNTPGGTTSGHGPGGGGGGGVILTNSSAASMALTAGTNGTTTVTATAANGGATTSTAYGSAAGVAGISNAQISTRIANSTAGANCAADVTVSLAGPTTLNAGQPTGTFTATFTNQGPSIAVDMTRLITLPAGATLTPDQLATIKRTYPNFTFDSNTNILNFGNLASLASDASSAATFVFTAPTTVGASTLTGNTGPGPNGSSEGINFAPDQSTLALTTVTTADVKAAITASTNAAGTIGTFDVAFSNIGAQTAAGVVRTVQLRRNLTGVTVTGSDAGSYDPTTGWVTYTTSPTTIAVGSPLTSSISYPLTGSINPVTATATVSTTTNEAGLRDNNMATAVMPASFDLATTLTGPTTTNAGSPTVLYVTTSNNGPNSAPVATQTVAIPSAVALTNVYMTNGGTYSYNTGTKVGTVTFPDVANLPSGATVTNSVSFTVPVNDASPTNSTAPSATVAITTGDTNTANNSVYLNGSTTSTSITVLGSTTTTNNTIAKANEQTTITANATIVDAGTVVTYTVTAKNAGSPGTTTVPNVVEQVQLLPRLTTSTLTVGGTTGTLLNNVITFATAPGGVTTYNTVTGVVTYPTITSQASGTTTTFDALAVTVPANVGNDGQLLATASVSTDDVDPIPSDNTSSVVVKVKTTADLGTTITGPTATTAGQTASYTATFRNSGPGTATSVVETVQLPIGLSNVNVVVQDASGNVINNAYNATTGIVTLPAVPSDASGTSQSYGISFMAPGQPYVVSSNISSGTIDNVVTNNTSVLNTTVSPTADVAIYLNGPATAVAGNDVTYAVTATNNGPNVATAVTPTLQLPAGLTGAAAATTNPDNSSNNGVTVTGGGYYNASTGLVTFPTATLVSGDSRVGLVNFIMPNSPTNGLVTGAATYSFGGTTPSVDMVASNNTAGITTAIAPATQNLADLVVSLTAPTSPVIAGSSVSYGVSFTNNSTTTAAIKVMPVAYLPAGLTGVVISDGNGATVPGASYNSTTGQVTFPTIDSQAAGNTASYTINLTAPANTVVISASAVSSDTSDPDPSNNIFSNTLTITPSFDVVTKLTGPTSATPGSTNTYTVTTTNNGPSTSPTTANTTQMVTVPANSVVAGLPNTATYNSGTGVITFAAISGQATGANGAVITSFTVQMPATGTLSLQANVTLTGESNLNNNQDNLITQPFNPAPVAQNIWNALRSARGNTATSLPISSLMATDNVSVASYNVVATPSPAQGTLYYNGSQVLPGQTVTANGLSFVPTVGYVGDATFTYTATDGSGAVSNVALYTIPVAADRDAVYTTYNNNKPGPAYTVGTVLGQVVDPNAAVYNNTGVIYDVNGAMQVGTANGIANATVPAGTLPQGVSLDPATGRLYVSGALANSTSPQTYNLSITTTDSNGGTTVVPVTFTIGANPLPVVLVSFTAQAAQLNGILKWATASEARNDHFELERSLDGTAFTQIGKVAGHGTTSAASAYVFTDAGVGRLATGPVYYRLRQVDYDGTSTYSPVRSVSFAPAAVVSLSLYPNPTADRTSLDLSQLGATAVQVQLLDATGRAVLNWTLAGGQVQLLDVHTLATGTYLLRVDATQPDGTALHQTLRLTKE